MRAYGLPLILLLTALRPAAADSAFIPLHHLHVGEIERQLLPGSERKLPPQRPTVLQEPGLVPEGITAWAGDDGRNGFEVSGSAGAIQAFRRVIQLLDVPVSGVVAAVRILPLVEGGLPGLHTEPFSPNGPGLPPTDLTAGTVGTEGLMAALQARPAISSSVMSVAANHGLHLRWQGAPDHPSLPVTILPRVNGDGTVTLYVSGLNASAADRGSMVVLRRLPPRQGVALLSQTRGTALLISFREVLPRAAGGD